MLPNAPTRIEPSCSVATASNDEARVTSLHIICCLTRSLKGQITTPTAHHHAVVLPHGDSRGRLSIGPRERFLIKRSMAVFCASSAAARSSDRFLRAASEKGLT
jgi:hypothetical protein